MAGDIHFEQHKPERVLIARLNSDQIGPHSDHIRTRSKFFKSLKNNNSDQMDQMDQIILPFRPSRAHKGHTENVSLSGPIRSIPNVFNNLIWSDLVRAKCSVNVLQVETRT